MAIKEILSLCKELDNCTIMRLEVPDKARNIGCIWIIFAWCCASAWVEGISKCLWYLECAFSNGKRIKVCQLTTVLDEPTHIYPTFFEPKACWFCRFISWLRIVRLEFVSLMLNYPSSRPSIFIIELYFVDIGSGW